MSTATAPLLVIPRVGVYAALGTVYLLWSTTFLGIAFALRGIPPFMLGGGRYALAGLIMAVVATALGHARPSGRQLASSMLLGLFFVAVGNGALTWGQQYVPTGTAALLGAVGPLFLLVAEALLPGSERPTKRGALGVVTGFAGVALLVGSTLDLGAGMALVGEAVLVAAAGLGTTGLLLAKRLDTPASWAWHSAATMIGGGGALLVLAALAGEPGRFDIGAVPAAAWAGFAHLVLLGSCVGFSCFAFLTQHARPALVATISYVIPVLATVLGALVLAETVTAAMGVAAALIVGSVALVATGGRRSPLAEGRSGP